MRGADTYIESLFSIKKLDDFATAHHPLRAIRAMVNDTLSELEELFVLMYEEPSKGGHPSIAPQKLLRAMLLQVPYSVRLRAPAHGASAIQPAVSLVHWAVDGRQGLGAHRLHQEPPAPD